MIQNLKEGFSILRVSKASRVCYRIQKVGTGSMYHRDLLLSVSANTSKAAVHTH